MALKGLKVLEMKGLAPGPFCGSILADFGATVTVVQKLGPSSLDIMNNGKKIISLNLKCKEGNEIFKKLCSVSDVLIDTYRPGVLEKLGAGPDILLKENKKLIYARLTGYGQEGLNRDKGGHDINYVAMSGVLAMLSKNREPPYPPINIIADFAGGSLLCALGILLALIERTKSGKGQIVDASMTDGAAYIATWLFKSKNLPFWRGEPGTNILDGGSPYYATYLTKDSKYMAVGALEPQFYSNFIKGLNLSEEIYTQNEEELCRKKFEEVFLTKTQDEWCTIFKDLDACVTPVLETDMLPKENGSFYINEENLIVPEPAPKLSSTPGVASGKQNLPKAGEHTIDILTELGYSKLKIKEFIENNYVYAYKKSNL